VRAYLTVRSRVWETIHPNRCLVEFSANAFRIRASCASPQAHSPISMTNSLRRLICQLLIGAILFAQMAVAAYACPATLHAGASVATSVDTMPADCDQMMGALDPAAPNLCSAHCHNDERSAQHADAPALPPALLVALYWIALPPTSDRLPQNTESGVLHAALSPPHAILHCCFRI